MPIRVACIGGGPGGLFFAALLKQQVPDAEVVLFERNAASDVFGFGVVFSDSTLRHIEEADPVLRDGLRDFGVHWDAIQVWLRSERISFAGNGMAAIHRKVLLGLLQARAAEVGVDMRFGTFIGNLAELEHFDLIVGADGSNSQTREQIIDQLGHVVETASAKFIWFATTYRFGQLTFIHRRSEYGNFAVHAYPIGEGLSTFIVETDRQTWLAAGLDEFDVTQPPGASDLKSQSFLEALFADDIDGEPLVANNSRWGNFQTRSSVTWHHDRVVLLGDAVHTAHFSVGSGTKMAMEDAVVLAREVAAHQSNLETALRNYEEERRPRVGKIQNAARPSLSWWEHFARYYESFSPVQFAFHFFSRSIPLGKLRERDPGFAAAVQDDWHRRHGSPALQSRLKIGESEFASRVLNLHARENGWWLCDESGEAGIDVVADPERVTASSALAITAPDAEAGLPVAFGLLEDCSDAAAVVVRGGTPLTRTLVSEQARLQAGLTTVIVGGDRDYAETLILSGRCDAVVLDA